MKPCPHAVARTLPVCRRATAPVPRRTAGTTDPTERNLLATATPEAVPLCVESDIADPGAFKDVYREQLDAAPWDAEERERVIDEVLLAYRFNTELFDDLGSARSAHVA